MSDKRYVVPEGMLKAIEEALSLAFKDFHAMGHPTCSVKEEIEFYWAFMANRAGESVAVWLSENPIVPTEQQCSELWKNAHEIGGSLPCNIAVEWQRRCFLAPDPEVPEELKDLLNCTIDQRKSIIEAFRRGQRSKQHPEG